MQTEQKLIKRIKKKQDKEAANTLISYYYKEIYAYVYRQTGNEELAKDLTQDIFIQILQKIAMFDHKKASFRTWMYRIASNKICDHYRSKVHRLSLKQEQIDMTDENLELHSGNLGTAIRDLSELIIHKELIEDIMEIVSLYKQEWQEIFYMKCLSYVLDLYFLLKEKSGNLGQLFWECPFSFYCFLTLLAIWTNRCRSMN